jgi:hypothetical protein
VPTVGSNLSTRDDPGPEEKGAVKMRMWPAPVVLRAGLAGCAGAGAFVLLSRGRLALDVGWGRSYHPLGPIVETIDAPRSLVWEIVAAPYTGAPPAAVRAKVRVLEREGNLVVAAHRTPLPVLDAVTVETMRLKPPDKVAFTLLRGPVPEVSEEFVLEEVDGRTRLTYRGELGADLWWFGRLYGGRLIRPAWERVVRESIDTIKRSAEERERGRRRRGKGGS